MTTTTNIEAVNSGQTEREAFKEFRAALYRMNDANTPVSVADRVMILSNATFLLDEYERAASPAPASPSGEPGMTGELDPHDALRYMACRASALERGLFATPEEYDAMVDDSLRKKGKEVLTGRGNNYGKKVAKDGSLHRRPAHCVNTCNFYNKNRPCECPASQTDNVSWEALFDRVALELNCLPSSFVTGNDHVFHAIGKLKAVINQVCLHLNIGEVQQAHDLVRQYLATASSSNTLPRASEQADEAVLTEEMIDAARPLFLAMECGAKSIESIRDYFVNSGSAVVDSLPEWFRTGTGHLTKAGKAIVAWHAMEAARAKDSK